MLDPDSDDYWKDFIGQIANKYYVSWPCGDIFNEAWLCYKNGVYQAACIMCRDSLEAILDIAAVRPRGLGEMYMCGSCRLRKKAEGKNVEELKKKVEECKPLSKAEKEVLENCQFCENGGCEGFKVYFKNLMRLNDLINWAKGEHLLDGLESKVECIRNDGDYSVHLAQKQDRVPFSPTEMLNIRQFFQVVKRETARQRILDTAEVIKQVARKKWPTS